MGVFAAAAIPSIYGVVKMAKTAVSVETIKEQVLPGNGRKLHQYITDLERETLELKDGLLEVKWELKEHIEAHAPKKRTTKKTAEHKHTSSSTKSTKAHHHHTHNYSGFGAASYVSAASLQDEDL